MKSLLLSLAILHVVLRPYLEYPALFSFSNEPSDSRFVPLSPSRSSLFSLSFKRFIVFGVPLLNTNIYSKVCQYVLLFPTAPRGVLRYIIVSKRLKPTCLKYRACLKDVPVSSPLIVWSPTTHTTTPPFFITLNKPVAILSKLNEYPL